MDERIEGSWIERRQTATRDRITDKAGEKAEHRNTLERYSVTEKEAAKREGGKEAWAEKMENREGVGGDGRASR